MKSTYTLSIVVCFVIILIFSSVYKAMSDKNSKIPWPPHVSKCPDYWVLSPGNPSECKPMRSDGDKRLNVLNGKNVSVPAYTTGTDIDEFRQTAMLDASFKHWDGVSNQVVSK